MNNPNPFVPKGSILELQSKRRSRLKLAVFCVIAVGVAGFSAMLIQGCKREQPADTTDNSTPTIDTNTAVAADTNAPTMDTNPPVVTPPVAMAPPVVAPPSFMVFFDWDRSNLSQQALTTIQQAANAFKAKGNARIVATGHTDTSGPESYNMALSLRRANAVKDALVRDGVPAQAISVIGMGEKGLLVQTGDNVREPQNRRVEIVIQ